MIFRILPERFDRSEPGNLDDLMAAEEDPRRFLKPHAASGLIVDEAQKAPSLFSYLQGIVDESGKMGKFILTGLQNFLLIENITESLACVSTIIWRAMQKTWGSNFTLPPPFHLLVRLLLTFSFLKSDA